MQRHEASDGPPSARNDDFLTLFDPIEQGAELEPFVAEDARVRCPTGPVFASEILDYLAPELRHFIHQLVRNAKSFADRPGVRLRMSWP